MTGHDVEGAAPETRPLFRFRFSTEPLAALARRIATTPAPDQGVRSVVTANLDHVVQLRTNAGLREAYEHAWRRTIDGTPVLVYARLRGGEAATRVTGADLLPAVLERLDPARHRPYFCVSDDATVAGLRCWAERAGFLPDAVGFDVPPFGFENDPAYGSALAATIRDRHTTHLILGLGCPKSEIWIDRHRDELGDCYALSVGQAANFFAGTQRRAPRLLRRFGIEWLWRVGQEPRRLSRRYFLSSWSFFAALVDDVTGGTRS